MLMPTKEDVEFVTEHKETARIVAGIGVKGDWVLCNNIHYAKLNARLEMLEQKLNAYTKG